MILQHIRKKLSSDSFTFTFVVDESLMSAAEEVKTSREQLEDLKKNNPEVSALIEGGDFTQI